MRRTRTVLAVMVVATALCADRAIASAASRSSPEPQARSTGSSLAGRVIERLSRGFTRVMPVGLRHEVSRDAVASDRPAVDSPDRSAISIHPTYSPSESRLPPPTCA